MKFELNHDVIAKQVFVKASGDMKARRKVELLVKNAFEFYQKRQALMTVEQLDEIRPYRDVINISSDERNFIKQSEDGLAAEARRKFIYAAGISAILLALSVFALWNWRQAERRKKAAFANQLAVQSQQAFQNKNFSDAFLFAQESLKLQPENTSASQILSAVFHRNFIDFMPLCVATIQSKMAFTAGAYSSDGSKAALVSADSLVKIYQITEGGASLIHTFSQCDTSFAPVFSADNSKVILQKDSFRLVLHDFTTKNDTYLSSHTDYVQGAIFLLDGKIISWSNDGFAKLWEATGVFARDLGKHEGAIMKLVISPDSGYVAAMGDNMSKISVMGLSNLGLKVLQNEAKVRDIIFRDEQTLVVADDKGVELLRASGDKSNVFEMSEMANTPLAVIGRDGQMVLNIAGKEHTLHFQNFIRDFFDDPKKYHEQLRYNEIYESPNVVKNLGFARNCTLFWAVTEGDGVVEFRDVKSELQLVIRHSMAPTGVIFSGDEEKILTFSSDGVAKFWDSQAAHFQEMADLANAGMANTLKVQFFPNDTTVTTFAQNNPMACFDGKNITPFLKIETNLSENVLFSPKKDRFLLFSQSEKPALMNEKGDTIKLLDFEIEGQKNARFSKNGQHFLIYSDKNISVWNASDGQLLTDKIAVENQLKQVVFSADGSKILTSVEKDSVIIEWDLKGNRLQNLVEHELITTIEFSPDGNAFLTANTEGVLKIRSLDGRVLTTFPSQNERILQAEFFPDGLKILIKTDQTNAVSIWSKDGKLLSKPFNGRQANVFVGILPKNDLLFAAFPNSIQLWKWDGKVPVSILKDMVKDEKGAGDFAVSKNGERIVVSTGEGIAKVYRTPEGILAWLAARPNFGFADFEKTIYEIE